MADQLNCGPVQLPVEYLGEARTMSLVYGAYGEPAERLLVACAYVGFSVRGTDRPPRRNPGEPYTHYGSRVYDWLRGKGATAQEISLGANRALDAAVAHYNARQPSREEVVELGKDLPERALLQSAASSPSDGAVTPSSI